MDLSFPRKKVEPKSHTFGFPPCKKHWGEYTTVFLQRTGSKVEIRGNILSTAREGQKKKKKERHAQFRNTCLRVFRLVETYKP